MAPTATVGPGYCQRAADRLDQAILAGERRRYGYRKIHSDLREFGERRGRHRVYRLMRSAGLKAQVGYRKPTTAVTVHSDQGSQYTSQDWHSFLKAHGLEGSMSRRGNCHDNAVAESFFQLLKRERVRRHVYPTREAARSDVFNYIEMFYNSKRRHGFNDQLSPVEYEKRFTERLVSV